MSAPSRRRGPSPLHGIWLAVFGFDAALHGDGRGHQMGAMGLALLFLTLVVGEVIASRRESRD